jgi:hypothetical protein
MHNKQKIRYKFSQKKEDYHDNPLFNINQVIDKILYKMKE